MTVHVRRIRSDDGPLLKTMRLAALADTPFAFGSTHAAEAVLTDDDWTVRAERAAGGDYSLYVVAELDGGRVVGIAGAYRPDPSRHVVDLVSMWTAPEARRTGAGRLLVRAVVDWARSTGAAAVELWVTRGNDPAERLYRSMGFVETGDHQPLPSDPCKDELRMTLPLGPVT